MDRKIIAAAIMLTSTAWLQATPALAAQTPHPIGTIETVATFHDAMPTGVTVASRSMPDLFC